MRCSTSELLRRRAISWEESLYVPQAVCHPVSAFPRRIRALLGKIVLASSLGCCFMQQAMLSLYPHIAKLWRRVPFRHVLAMTIFLSFWGDDGLGQQYPFTNFPMYSHLDAESDVLYVTDQTDQPLPFHTLFGTSTSTQKKVFINELKKICNPKGRDTRDALPEERRAAGEKLLEKLLPRLKKDRVPAWRRDPSLPVQGLPCRGRQTGRDSAASHRRASFAGSPRLARHVISRPHTYTCEKIEARTGSMPPTSVSTRSKCSSCAWALPCSSSSRSSGR